MGGALLINLLFLGLLLILYKRGCAIRRAHIISAVYGLWWGLPLMGLALDMQKSIGLWFVPLAILIFLACGAIGLALGWLLGVAIGKHSMSGKPA